MKPRTIMAAFAAVSLFTAMPVRAQFGGIVFDPHNYAQNVLTAARSLQQITNQIQSLQNQATMLENMAKNLSHLNFSSLSAITNDLQQISNLMNQAQRIGFQVQSAQTSFQQHFMPTYGAGTTIPQIATDAHTRWQDAMSGYGQAMTVQSQIVQTVQSDSTKLTALVSASQGATGSLQVAQAANQLMALSIKQQLQIQNLAAAQGRADALEKARTAADENAARTAFTQFIGTGNAYSPQ
ncbi:P-type conjugative transfer protein TrbJ [Sphingomonas abietis]|uniref:P-type conjugative transfer protein TrbJ n=1 Tax=Sphingomonas abietis TaxID=3012344 RepID=A0ABY7NSI4_9SPHN|nr:P-type conjugative transfer protein TrbJ [Sphingomonas abietis]WBO24333.1 P-type conjugative transfer protein TrbJ [Sphingomonas abietis]